MSLTGAGCRVLVGALLAGLSIGCVTKGKYEDLETKSNALETRRDELTAEVEALTIERDALAEQLAATELEAAEMQGTYDELVTELETEVAAGQIEVQQLVNGVRLNVSDELLFPSGSTTLNESGKKLLARVASQIKDEGAIISVEGHTDAVGVGPTLKQRYPTNWELAGARAAKVVRMLSEEGVDPTQLRAVSRGPFAPVADNDSEEGRAKNRRTEIILRPLPR